MKNLISIFILTLLFACGEGGGDDPGSDEGENPPLEQQINALTEMDQYSPVLVPKINEKIMNSEWLGCNQCRSSSSSIGNWEGFHLLFGVPDSTDTVCQIGVELPANWELSNVYKTFHGANDDTILYTVFYEANNQISDERAYTFDIGISAIELSASSAIVCELKDFNSTGDAVDQTFFDLSPLNSGTIVWNSSQVISGSNLKYRILKGSAHNQNCSNYEVFADLPIWLDYTSNQNSSNSFIGIGLNDNEDVDKVVFRKSPDYFAFDVHLKQGGSFKDDIALVELPLSKSDFNLIKNEKYIVRVFDSNGDKKKEKVIVAQAGYEPKMIKENKVIE